MFAIIAFIPIIVTIIVMAGFNWPAKSLCLWRGSLQPLYASSDGRWIYYNCSTHRIRIPYIH